MGSVGKTIYVNRIVPQEGNGVKIGKIEPIGDDIIIGDINTDRVAINASQQVELDIGGGGDLFVTSDIVAITPNVGDLRVQLFNLPTSSAGLPSGSVWNDSNTLKIVP